jgi:hypothetical protein
LIFYVRPSYCAVYISGLKWTRDIPNIVRATVCTSPFPFTPKYLPLG